MVRISRHELHRSLGIDMKGYLIESGIAETAGQGKERPDI